MQDVQFLSLTCDNNQSYFINDRIHNSTFNVYLPPHPLFLLYFSSRSYPNISDDLKPQAIPSAMTPTSKVSVCADLSCVTFQDLRNSPCRACVRHPPMKALEKFQRYMNTVFLASHSLSI